MRIWTVPFGELDDQRVLGQHVEIHMLWNTITKFHRKFMGWEDPHYRLHLWEVHKRIVEEMTIRGMKHHTPIEFPTYEYCLFPPQTRVLPALESLLKDRWDLVERWRGEYLGRIEMPSEYFSLIGIYRKEFQNGELSRSSLPRR
jgi:hypothetical protein